MSSRSVALVFRSIILLALRCLLPLVMSSLLSAAARAAPVVLEATPTTAGDLIQSIRKLGVTGRVLHVAAHPDDENTRLLAWLANEVLVDTAYLSLTRGDGGQNLIGPELREELGLIRTQELLAARRIDGAQQFFTRAVDFGYSKTMAETLRIWDHEAVLADVVWVIRSFRPDIIVTRFEPQGDYTHGHHTASSFLAVEAFEAAGDPSRFPEQLAWVEPWQPKRVVWNTGRWFFQRRGLEFDESALAREESGGYLPLRGESTGDVAARGRSMHKSQGFGSGGSRGRTEEYFKLLAGEPMDGSLFDDVPLDWTRFADSEALERLAAKLRSAFDPNHPNAAVPDLLAFRQLLKERAGEPLFADKVAEVDRILAACLGLHAECLLPRVELLPGETVTADLNLVQQVSGPTVEWETLSASFTDRIQKVDTTLQPGSVSTQTLTIEIPKDVPTDHPYWLRADGTSGLFSVNDQMLIGTPENAPSVAVDISLSINGERIDFTLPAVHRTVDPVEGERRTPVHIVPAVYVNFQNSVEIFAGEAEQAVTLQLGGNGGEVSGTVRLEMPDEWQATPDQQPFHWSPSDSPLELSFLVTPDADHVEGLIRAAIEVKSDRYAQSFRTLDYPHIPAQVFTGPAAVRAVTVDLAHFNQTIGYLPGAGDTMAENLRTVGLKVHTLDDASLTIDSLDGLDAVVVGIRALNTIDNIDAIMTTLFDFAENGGTVVVQYNTSRGLKTDRLAPYPLTLSRDRVTDETAAVTLLAPQHPVLNTPNRITSDDFDGWVQERGLYFPSDWDDAFTPILSYHDEGEEPLSGSLLVAEHGQGYFVYTGISFFRQLPAGVPGAYRLFVNLLSLGHE